MTLKPCKCCGTKPKIEMWHSGGCMFMIRCPHPGCPVPVDGFPTGRDLEEVGQEWNKRQEWNRRVGESE